MAVSNKNLIDSMIQGIQKKDPKLYEILKLMSKDLAALLDDLRPVIDRITTEQQAELPPLAPDNFTYSLSNIGVTLSWTYPDASIGSVAWFEIRKGSDWDTAERITKTASYNVFLNPLAVGSHTYMIRTIGRNGLNSIVIQSVIVVIPSLGSLSLSANCIDNNVLLSWTVPTATFRIDYYQISKDGSPYGKASSTFSSIFESSAGAYVYGVKAVDVAGNIGPESFISVEVKQPPDYVLVTDRVSDFSGTKDGCILEDGKLWAILELAKTWETHFTSRGWNNINDQLLLGYDHFLDPGGISGYYEEVVDFGAIFQNVIINLDWDYVELGGNVIVGGQIEVSDDGLAWSAPVAGISCFAASCRYARVRLVFTGSDDDLIIITNFRILLDVKQETDSGNVDALAADTDGTVVLFNKVFKDVNSITLTTKSVEPLYAVYNFVDVPNPTQFKILVFDSAGNRVNYNVSWKARGVV